MALSVRPGPAQPAITKPRIAVVGAGAVGGYIGAHLAHAGHDVTLIDPWPAHVEAMRAKGLKISGMTDAEALTAPVKAIHITEAQHLAKERPIDIAILSVKSYDTVWAARFIAQYLSADGYIVSAQNSINETAIASVVGWDKTVGCMVGNNYAVDLYEPACIRRTMPKGGTYAALQVGEVHGRITPRLRQLADIMSAVDKSDTTTNLWGVRWSKLVVNGMRNGVSAATGMGGNERDGHDTIRRIVMQLAGEAVNVGRALGLDLETIAGLQPDLYSAAIDGNKEAYAKVEASMIAGTKGTARSALQRPSMAQDMAKGRRTEIEHMNGLIAARGKSAGSPAPTHDALKGIVQRVERGEIPAKPENLFHLLPNR
jgi:2-dehydropantoate 2-reductase